MQFIVVLIHHPLYETLNCGRLCVEVNVYGGICESIQNVMGRCEVCMRGYVRV